jgi:hypothetical protein
MCLQSSALVLAIEGRFLLTLGLLATFGDGPPDGAPSPRLGRLSPPGQSNRGRLRPTFNWAFEFFLLFKNKLSANV